MTSPFIIPGLPPKTGHLTHSTTTYPCIPGVFPSSLSTGGPPSDTDSYSPWYTDSPLRIEAIYAEVTTAAATGAFRMGFYAADVDWQPVGPALADSGDIATDATGLKTYTPSTPIYVPRGRYLSVVNTDLNPQLRTVRGSVGSATSLDSGLSGSPFISLLRVLRTYGAFPNPGTAWTAVSGNTIPMAHFVFYKVGAA